MKYERWQDVVIIGPVDHAVELYSYIQDLTIQGQMISLIGFLDEERPGGEWRRIRLLDGFEELEALVSRDPESAVHYITAGDDNRRRAEVVRRIERLEAPNLAAWTLRHLRATVGFGAEVGDGSRLAPGSVVASGVSVGKHCGVNINASISRGARIGDFCNISPGAVIASNARLGEGCFIGPGAVVADNVSVGDWTTIGAGAVVREDVPPRATTAKIGRVINLWPDVVRRCD